MSTGLTRRELERLRRYFDQLAELDDVEGAISSDVFVRYCLNIGTVLTAGVGALCSLTLWHGFLILSFSTRHPPPFSLLCCRSIGVEFKKMGEARKLFSLFDRDGVGRSLCLRRWWRCCVSPGGDRGDRKCVDPQTNSPPPLNLFFFYHCHRMESYLLTSWRFSPV